MFRFIAFVVAILIVVPVNNLRAGEERVANRFGDGWTSMQEYRAFGIKKATKSLKKSVFPMAYEKCLARISLMIVHYGRPWIDKPSENLRIAAWRTGKGIIAIRCERLKKRVIMFEATRP